ncbi:MAG: FIST C-terminal domain-containing protein, partial [Clostridiales bacterium]|nr:FIST C-terminal domain-containing protein [Clostridiales bacterium]
YGAIHPRFMITALPPDPSILNGGEITKAEGTCVYEINHMNAFEYYDSLDFIEMSKEENNMTLFTPLIVDLKRRKDYDGIPVVRGNISFTEDGAAIYTGDVDEGSTFVFSVCNYETILSTTRQTVEQVNALSEVNGVLLLPCIVRRMALFGIDPMAELQESRQMLKQNIPYMMGYSGGEICPTSIHEGIPTNRFHNYSLAILIV